MSIVPYGHVLILSALILSMGVWCILSRRSLIMTLIGIEVMMNAVAIAFVGAALKWRLMEGHAFVLFIIAVAAAEVSVGLALVVAAFQKTGTVDPDAYHTLEH